MRTAQQRSNEPAGRWIRLRSAAVIRLAMCGAFLCTGPAAFGAMPGPAVIYRDDAGHHIAWPGAEARNTIAIPEPIGAGRGDGIVVVATVKRTLLAFDDKTGEAVATYPLPYKPIATGRSLPPMVVHSVTKSVVYTAKFRRGLHMVVAPLGEGRAKTFPVPETLDNAAVADWNGGVYVVSHVAGDDGHCADTPMLHEFDPATGAFTPLDWNRLTADYQTTLYGTWHGGDATMREAGALLTSEASFAKAGSLQAAYFQRRSDVLRIDADAGSDDERLRPGRGFILTDDAGEHTIWAIPLGIPVHLVRFSENGSDIYAQRSNELLKLRRNTDTKGVDPMFKLIVSCAGGLGQFGRMTTSSGGEGVSPGNGLEGGGDLGRTSGFGWDGNGSFDGPFPPIKVGSGSSEREHLADFPPTGETEVESPAIIGLLGAESDPTATTSSVPRLMTEDVVWTVPSGATVLEVLE